MELIKNKFGIYRKDPGPPKIILENNIGHKINPQNIVTVNNISRVDKDQPLLHIIHMEVNHPSIAETFTVVYLLYPVNLIQ